MTHVSKKWIEPEVWKYITDSLTYLVKDLDNAPDTQKFLNSILSDTERLMIAKRIVLAFLLKHDVGTEKICDLLKLTPATVFRQKLWIQTHQEGFDVIFAKMERKTKRDAVKEIFYKLLQYTVSASSGNVSAITKKR